MSDVLNTASSPAKKDIPDALKARLEGGGKPSAADNKAKEEKAEAARNAKLEETKAKAAAEKKKLEEAAARRAANPNAPNQESDAK